MKNTLRIDSSDDLSNITVVDWSGCRVIKAWHSIVSPSRVRAGAAVSPLTSYSMIRQKALRAIDGRPIWRGDQAVYCSMMRQSNQSVFNLIRDSAPRIVFFAEGKLLPTQQRAWTQWSDSTEEHQDFLLTSFWLFRDQLGDMWNDDYETEKLLAPFIT